MRVPAKSRRPRLDANQCFAPEAGNHGRTNVKTSFRRVRNFALGTALGMMLLAAPALGADAYPPTPDVPCDSGSLPESTQGLQ